MKNTAPSPIPTRFLAAMPRSKTDHEIARKARAIICVHKLLETLYRGVPETEPQAAGPQPMPQPVTNPAPMKPPAVSFPSRCPA